MNVLLQKNEYKQLWANEEPKGVENMHFPEVLKSFPYNFF